MAFSPIPITAVFQIFEYFPSLSLGHQPRLLPQSLLHTATSISSPTWPISLLCFFICGRECVGAVCLGMEEGENGANINQMDSELVLLLQ